MKWTFAAAAAGLAVFAFADGALADGELHIFNWGDYTSPDLIRKFEEVYKVKVTITDFDSNDTALAKIKAGGHGFDIVVPLPISFLFTFRRACLRKPGLIRWRTSRTWTRNGSMFLLIPAVTTRYRGSGERPGFVNTKVYSGDPNTSAIFLDPPEELKGKINVVPEMGDVMYLAIRYVGGEPCTGDKEVLKKVRDKLMAAKPYWISMDYSNPREILQGGSGSWSELERLVSPSQVAE